MKSLFRFSLIFFSEIFGLLCSGVFIKVNRFTSSLGETGNGWLIRFGFVTDSFHIDWRSFINKGRNFIRGLWFWRFPRNGFLKCWKMRNLRPWGLLIVTDYCDSWFLRAIFSVGIKELVWKIQKIKLHCLEMFSLGRND